MRIAVLLVVILAALTANCSADDNLAVKGTPTEDSNAWNLNVLVVDEATGQPIPDPHISLQWGNKTTAHEGDATGSAIITLPSRDPSYCYLRVRAAGYAPMRAFWSNRAGPDEMPEAFAFAMSKAIKVGGRVIDEDGGPVAGATVFFSAGDSATQTGRLAESSFYREEYKTDAEGRWECDIAPPNLKDGSFGVDHPDFARVTENWSVDDQIEELRSFTHTWKLQPSFKVCGHVTDSDGKPIEGAVLAMGRSNSYYSSDGPFPKTDAEGYYEFSRVGAPSGSQPDADPRLTITVMKVGLAPMMQRITGWERGARRAERYMKRTMDFVLKSGRTMRVHVVDSAGNSIPSIWVQPEEWNSARPFLAMAKFGLPLRTDDKGVWEWTWAPPNENVKYVVYGQGDTDVRDRPITAAQAVNEVTIVLQRPQNVLGRAIDAVTKKPIDSFVVQRGFEGFSDRPGGVYWDTSTETRGRNGQYAKLITDVPHNGSYRYRALAEGYEPRISDSVKFEEGQKTLDFELTPLSVPK